MGDTMAKKKAIADKPVYKEYVNLSNIKIKVQLKSIY